MDPSVWPQYVVEPQYIEGYFEERVWYARGHQGPPLSWTIAFP